MSTKVNLSGSGDPVPLKAYQIWSASPDDTEWIVDLYVSIPSDIPVSPFLPFSLSLYVYFLHLHIPPDSKRGSALNSSVHIAYWHGIPNYLSVIGGNRNTRWRKDDSKNLKQTSIASVLLVITNSHLCELLIALEVGRRKAEAMLILF